MARTSTKGLVAGALIRVKHMQRKFARGEFLRTFEHPEHGTMVEYTASYNLSSRTARLKDVVVLRRQGKRPESERVSIKPRGRRKPVSKPAHQAPLALTGERPAFAPA